MTDERRDPRARRRAHDRLLLPPPREGDGGRGSARFVKTTAPGPVAPPDVDRVPVAESGRACNLHDPLKTTAADPAAPQDVVRKRKPGGQPGNRNAWKTGVHN